MAKDQLDPYGNYHFQLEIDGVKVATFMECSGLKSTTEVFEIEEGGMNGRTYKRPGRAKWENIVLRFASSASLHLLQWRDEFLQDNFGDRRDGSISLEDNNGEVVRRWSFKNAWPVSWEGPSLNAGSSELAIETLEIAHEGLTVGNG